MTKVRIIDTLDIVRVVSILILTILVSVFVAPSAPWVLVISVFASVYVVAMELLKFYVGIRQIREGKHNDIVSIERNEME